MMAILLRAGLHAQPRPASHRIGEGHAAMDDAVPHGGNLEVREMRAECFERDLQRLRVVCHVTAPLQMIDEDFHPRGVFERELRVRAETIDQAAGEGGEIGAEQRELERRGAGVDGENRAVHHAPACASSSAPPRARQ